MNRKKAGKALRITGISILVIIFSLLTWANWEPKTYTETHVPNDTKYVMLDAPQLDSPIDVEKAVSKIEGISTCSYNSASKVIGVIYYTSKLSESELHEKVGEVVGCPVSGKEITEAAGGCPVGGVRYFMLAVKSALKFRS